MTDGLYLQGRTNAVETGETARAITGVTLGPLLLPGNLTVIPAHANFSAFSPTYLAVFLVAACAVPLLLPGPRPYGAACPVLSLTVVPG